MDIKSTFIRGETKMINKLKKEAERHYQALYEELEKRYGPYAAQDIVDQIRKMDDQADTPEFMDVKAVSEALELLRLELRNSINRLKVLRHEKSHWPCGIEDLEEKRLEYRINRLLPVYWIIMQGFYRLYTKAMTAYDKPYINPYKKVRQEPEQMAA